jgi:multidrug efflux pump subunit AcrA (membrane-fusion protein)
LWFELYLDQTAIGQVQPGAKVEVRLAAFSNESLSATVSKVRPLVNFSLGGPETNRPIRPLGTGSPEWPATFSVRATFDHEDKRVVPGLTGFGRVVMTRQSICVPLGTVTAVSTNRGIVFVVDESGTRFEPRNVSTGANDDQWTEITEGLSIGDRVIIDGYQVLEPGDSIDSSELDFESDSKTRTMNSDSSLSMSGDHR